MVGERKEERGGGRIQNTGREAIIFVSNFPDYTKLGREKSV